MSLFGTAEEVENLRKDLQAKDASILDLKEGNVVLRGKNEELEKKLERLKEKHDFDIEKAKFDLAKEVEKRLHESDIQRAEALASLKAYEKMDTKSDREHMRKMLEKAI